MLHCRWNSIHIISIVSFSEILDTTLRGRIVNVSVGRDSVGSFSIRGALHSADGDIAISASEDVVKRCVGSTPWMLVRFALSSKEEDLDGFDQQYLEMLGLSLKSVENQLDFADGAFRHQKDRSVKADDTVFVHC